MKVTKRFLPTGTPNFRELGAWVAITMRFGVGFAAAAVKVRISASGATTLAGAGMTRLAAWAAGRRRDLYAAWLADLAGDPEAGISLSPGQRRRLAAGFVLAAVRMRLHDVFGWTWRPVDWVLRSDKRTNAFIASVVGVQAIYIVDDGGIPALVTEIWEPCGILGAGLYVLARWLRRVRGIELATASPPPED